MQPKALKLLGMEVSRTCFQGFHGIMEPVHFVFNIKLSEFVFHE